MAPIEHELPPLFFLRIVQQGVKRPFQPDRRRIFQITRRDRFEFKRRKRRSIPDIRYQRACNGGRRRQNNRIETGSLCTVDNPAFSVKRDVTYRLAQTDDSLAGDAIGQRLLRKKGRKIGYRNQHVGIGPFPAETVAQNGQKHAGRRLFRRRI